MSFPFEHYIKIKNNICILYNGLCEEYLFLLKIIRPLLNKQFPELKIYIACKDNLVNLLENEPNVISKSILDKELRNFGLIKEIKTNFNGPHPIEKLLSESNINPIVINNQAISENKLCCIFTNGNLPTRNLSKDDITKISKIVSSKGYTIWLNPKEDHLEQSGWVIGVESKPLFKAAYMGIKTTLVPTGIGEWLYKKLFPNGEVFKI